MKKRKRPMESLESKIKKLDKKDRIIIIEVILLIVLIILSLLLITKFEVISKKCYFDFSEYEICPCQKKQKPSAISEEIIAKIMEK